MTNERPLHTIIDCNTNTTVQVPFTDEEWAARLEEDKKMEELYNARKAEEARVETLKASAKAKLIAGEPLTEDEASVLII